MVPPLCISVKAAASQPGGLFSCCSTVTGRNVSAFPNLSKGRLPKASKPKSPRGINMNKQENQSDGKAIGIGLHRGVIGPTD